MKKWISLLIVLCLFNSFSILAKETYQSFAVISDAGFVNHSIKKIKKSIKKSGINRLIMAGDNLYDTSLNYQQVWGSWLKDDFKFDVVALGNHNLGYEREVDFFQMPGEYYQYKSGKHVFIVLNSDDQSTVSKQKAFLENTLNDLQDRAVIVFHHPPVSLTSKHNWTEKKHFHDEIFPVLLKFKNKVSLVIVGHDHITGLYDINGIPLLISGATGEQFQANNENYQDSTRTNIFVSNHFAYNGHPHWVRLDFSQEDNNIWLNFVDAIKNKVTCSVLIGDGFTFKRKNCFKD